MRKGVEKLTAKNWTAKKIPKWGWIGIGTTPNGVCKIELGRAAYFLRGKYTVPSKAEQKIFRQIENYLRGKSKTLHLKIDLQNGTPFQKQVWKSLRCIPFGQVKSYGWVAQKIKRPKAFRAIGQACGANPLPLFFPCHRVIAGDGTIGGFSGGLGCKRRLLRIEGYDKIKL